MRILGQLDPNSFQLIPESRSLLKPLLANRTIEGASVGQKLADSDIDSTLLLSNEADCRS
jgi:hypothetical protein